MTGRDEVRKGQIAHLNHDPSDSRFQNLVFLCFEHHDEYDSRTGQSKGFTAEEVREYRDRLYSRNGALPTPAELTVLAHSTELSPLPETSEYDEVRNRFSKELKFTRNPWRYPLWQVANEPELFAYKAGNRADGVCLIERIDLPDGRIVISCIAVTGNPGNSITNCVEELCFQVCERFEIPAEKLVWLEHYDYYDDDDKTGEDIEHEIPYMKGYTSLQDARERWEKHLKPVFGAVRASQVTTDKLEAYKDARLTTKAAKATINRELALLRLAFNLGRKARKLQFVPHFPMYRENNTRKGFLEDAQYDKLATACAKRGLWLRAMFETAVQLGWRSGELKGMLVQQADIAAKTLRLEPGTTKNRDGRTAVMPATLAMLIQQCATGKKAGDFLFTRDGGQPIKDFRGAWEEATKEAGVPDLLFHDLRRTAVRNMVRRGIAERVAMGITGHRTRSVFDRYHIVSGSDLREAAEKMSQPIPSLTIDSQSNGEGRNILPN